MFTWTLGGGADQGGNMQVTGDAYAVFVMVIGLVGGAPGGGDATRRRFIMQRALLYYYIHYAIEISLDYR